MSKMIITSSKEETQKIGEDLANKLEDKNIIALYGDLGSGKTTFVQGLAKGLGIKKRIISPTFVIVRTYGLKIKNKKENIKNTYKKLKMFYHVDLYRVENKNDIEKLGISEITSDPQNIIAIEWAEKMGSLLSRERIDIRFAYMSENKRRILINIKNKILNSKDTKQKSKIFYI